MLPVKQTMTCWTISTGVFQVILVIDCHCLTVKFLASTLPEPSQLQADDRRFSPKTLVPGTTQSHIEVTLKCVLFELRLNKVYIIQLN